MPAVAALSQTTKFFHLLDETIESGKFTYALELILSNFESFSQNAPLRERVALVLAGVGKKKKASHLLELLARHYANSGQPMRCLAVIQSLMRLQPDASGPLLDQFSALYSVRSPYLTPGPAQPIPELADPEGPLQFVSETAVRGLDQALLLQEATERAMDKEELAGKPGNLPRVALMSELPTESLRRLLAHAHYEIFAQSQTILKPEEIPAELIWSVNPTLLLRREDQMFRLPSGSLVGLSGFGTPPMPSLSQVTVPMSSGVLKLTPKAIEKLKGEIPDFQARLSSLYRASLVEGLLQTHPLFAPLAPSERPALLERFLGMHVASKEVLIKQRATSPGLFVLLDGQVDIVRQDEDWEITIATLNAGEVFGEIGLVSEKSAVAGVVATQPSTMLFLSRAEFASAAQAHPPLRHFAVSLANQRLSNAHATLNAKDLSLIDAE